MEQSFSEDIRREAAATHRPPIRFWERLRSRSEESPETLLRLINTESQTNDHGQTRYLIGGGWSIDLASGVHRPHSDVDVVLLHPGWDFVRPKLRGKIQEFQPDEFFGVMDVTDDFLQQTQQKVRMGDQIALTVHPAITLVQKLGGYGERMLRGKDKQDAKTLLLYGKSKKEDRNVAWDAVLQHSIDALKPQERDRILRNLYSVSREL